MPRSCSEPASQLRGGGWGRAKAIWNFGVERCSVKPAGEDLRPRSNFHREGAKGAKVEFYFKGRRGLWNSGLERGFAEKNK